MATSDRELADELFALETEASALAQVSLLIGVLSGDGGLVAAVNVGKWVCGRWVLGNCDCGIAVDCKSGEWASVMTGTSVIAAVKSAAAVI